MISVKSASRFFLPAFLALLFVGNGENCAQTRQKIGIFDSRGVAVAYYNSKEYRKGLAASMSEMEAARSKGDKKEVARIERENSLRQAMMHEQGFGTGSVEGILAPMKDKLKALAEKEKLAAIVSKWELVYSGSDIDLVDLTEEIVALYEPDERMKQMTKELQKTEPVKDAYLIDD